MRFRPRLLSPTLKDLRAANLYVSQSGRACLGRSRRHRGRRIRSPAIRAVKERGGNRKLFSWSTLSWPVRREDGSPLRRATRSGVVLDCEHGGYVRYALAMLYTVRDHAEGERLGLGYGVLERRTVDDDSGQVGNLGDKTAVILSVNFYFKLLHTPVPRGFMRAVGQEQYHNHSRFRPISWWYYPKRR